MVGSYKKPIKVILSILLILGGAFAGFPVLWMFISSLKSNTEIFSWPPTFIDKSFSLRSYIEILTDAEKVRYFLNSYFVSAVVVVLTLVIGILAAYAFSRFDFPLKGLINTLIVSVQAVPPIVLLIPYLSLIVSLKLFNTYWALILTYLVFTLPYCILMITGYFNTLSTDLDEAVMIDGGSRMKALWKILVPVSVPGLVSVGMYTFMQAWNEYLFASTFMKSYENWTLPIGIASFQGQYATNWGTLMAGAVLITIPVVILFLALQKHLVGGMTAGAVKG